MTPVLIVLLVIAGLAMLVVPVLVIRRVGRRVMAEVLQKYPEHTLSRIDPLANLFGVRSRGMKQIRGNGVLLVTSGELYFRMLAPRRELTVPVRDIIGMGVEKSFLGKSKGIPLLRVDYRDGIGGTDSAAWAVRDVSGWLSTLETLTGKTSPPQG